ncbi:Rqc2 family fibronectin-binding protein [Inediibacterium massiliense]|uniref:Rqc2 family fibronectin-binding protein n=1 Tax=Inediibacterium massiliense TaxID=1658111 RepID=UPI0006B51C11|nr:NFACT RNA binding domain-containing protein [Inediibacterium massiliense]
MPFDGIVVSSIVHELKEKILMGKIDKIYQPENDEIHILIRCFKEKYKLLISASSNHPRIHLTHTDKINPQTPPIFCMLLRKHLQGGKIIDIYQKEFERIVVLSIESYDELGVLSIKQLVVEIMGKHSNIILLDPSQNKILDSIKRISGDINRYREILPGKNYIAPPTQGKQNPLNLSFEDFVFKLKESSNGTPIYKGIYKSFQGISPVAAREICLLSHIEEDKGVIELLDADYKNLWNNFHKFLCIKNQNPHIIISKENGQIVDFYPIPLKIYQSVYTSIDFDCMSDLLEQFYIQRDLFDRIKQKSTDLRKLINHTMQKLLNKKQKLNEELLSAMKAQKYRIYGELLTANLHTITKGDKSVEVINFYDENCGKVTISLNEHLTPAQNAQKYFKKYTKSKNAQNEIDTQLKDADDEILYFENLIQTIENTSDLENIEEIRLELMEEGYIKKKKISSKKHTPSKPMSFISSDGYSILVGKNNKQNDQLTLKIASKKDLWLHTKDIPGSHVIIVTHNEEVPQATILEAAELAAYFSKGKISSNVPVDYTTVKYVKKPNGAKPGMVIYENNKTIYITPRSNIVEILQKNQSKSQ